MTILKMEQLELTGQRLLIREDLNVPVIDLNDVAAIADFIVGRCGLEGSLKHGAA